MHFHSNCTAATLIPPFYNVNIDTKEFDEVVVKFDYEELKEYASGFMEESEWLQ